MTSWMKERDRLLEQTLAFVQGVVAQRPIKPAVSSARLEVAPAAPPIPADVASDAASIETDALISMMTLPEAAPPSDDDTPPINPIVVADSEPPPRLAERPPVHQPAAQRPIELVLPERDVIARRVARFRARQQKLLQEREDHYAALQARIRASLGNDPFA